MDVHITFTGLCLFVPDYQHEVSPRVHVLLPQTNGGHKHHPQIMYPGLDPKPPVLEGGQQKDRFLTHQLTWVIEDADLCPEELWKLSSLAGSGSAGQDIGLPIPDPDGVVRIHVLHLPAKPITIKPCEEAHHTQEYYSVSEKKGKSPKLNTAPAALCPKRELENHERSVDRAEAAYNCMLGKSDAG